MKLLSRALLAATIVGTVLQVAMTTLGHTNPAIRGAFAAGGMGISFIAGILYVVISTEVLLRDNVIGGAIAGAVCAFVGILVSVVLGDVPMSLLLTGTVFSALTGALGGWVGRLFSSGRV
jgi:hypothetical protein